MKKIDLTDRNFTMKIIAAFFAFIMWMYVMSEVNPKIVKDIPNVKVTILNEESLKRNNLVLMDLEDNTVTVEVEGRRNDVIGISQSDIIAEIDLKGYREGVNKVPVNIKGVLNGEVIDYYPKYLEVSIDRLIEKQMPISVQLIGNPVEGYADGDVEVSPAEVLVKGPKSIVNTVDRVVAAINVEGIKKGFSTSVPMKLLNDDNKEITSLQKEPNTVKVGVGILKLKKVSIEPVIEGEPLVNHKLADVKIKPETITIKGPEDVVAGIDKVKTKPIDIGFENKDIKQKVELDLPEGVYVVDDIKPEISIDISKEVKQTLELKKEDIVVKNMDEKYTFILDETEKENNIIEVSFTGLEEIVEEIETKDINLYLDLADLSPGEHTVDIEIEDIEGILVDEIKPASLKIIIEDKSDPDEDTDEETDNPEGE